jgi:hypothetical protein
MQEGSQKLLGYFLVVSRLSTCVILDWMYVLVDRLSYELEN